MPSVYAHHQFGDRVMSALPEDVRELLQSYRMLFDLGLQGPDFFFYYRLGKQTLVRALAHEYHRRSGREVFSQICSELRKPSEPELAYLYGLLGHYCLDAGCHPIVHRITGADSLAHNALESEFERFLLERDGVKKPWQRNRGRYLRCRGDCAAVIARFYPEAEEKQIRESLHTMEVVLGLLTIHAGAKKVLQFMGGANPGLLMHRCPDPAFTAYNAQMLEGYNTALAVYPELLRQLHSHINLGQPLGEDFDPIFG